MLLASFGWSDFFADLITVGVGGLLGWLIYWSERRRERRRAARFERAAFVRASAEALRLPRKPRRHPSRGRYKVLPVSSFVTDELRKARQLGQPPRLSRLTVSVVPVPVVPVFARDGYYFDRFERRTWIELDGVAYAYGSPVNFASTLACHEAANHRLSDEVLAALRVLVEAKRATLEQAQALQAECILRNVRRVWLRVRRYVRESQESLAA